MSPLAAMVRAMNDTAVNGSPGEVHELYARANKLSVRLASKSDDALLREAGQLVAGLLEHVRAKVKDFDDFVRRVQLSEEFSLTESKQVPKTEKELRTLYVRAVSLQEAIDEARARRDKAR